MDDLVRQAMAKWPHVPDCYGWLALDSRGRWFLRDDATQARGPFPLSKGSELRHDQLRAFIERNYSADETGRWFFQNGPQRVFVELELTPLVWRIDPDGSVTAHTGQPAGPVQQCLLDEAGWGYLATDLGLGLVHSLDVPLLAQALDAGRWPLTQVRSADLPRRYGFVRSPAAGVQA